VDQIRDIYSGKTTKWKDLKISGLGDIMAYQRPENSGSQTALQKLMGDVPLMKAPEAVVAWDMGDIIDTIEYRNLPNAIGYTFRFFCSELTDNDVKMLSVNGVAPTIGNIRSGDYPITSTLYAVTRKGDDNPNTAAFLEWIQSSQGMELVEKSGYVPWYEPEIDLGTFDDPA
jgi:phosphate transport system substrate-binding protein